MELVQFRGQALLLGSRELRRCLGHHIQELAVDRSLLRETQFLEITPHVVWYVSYSRFHAISLEHVAHIVNTLCLDDDLLDLVGVRVDRACGVGTVAVYASFLRENDQPGLSPPAAATAARLLRDGLQR